MWIMIKRAISIMCSATVGGWAASACAASCPSITAAQVAPGPISVIHVMTGPDGESHFADETRTPEIVKLFGGRFTLTKYALSPQAKVTLVSGPANLKLPFHPSPYPEMFLELAGQAELILADGSHRMALPGMIVFMDDMHSHKGHSGLTGPCGYVSLSISPQAK
jgi:quercetin dioxygenase-like cupin family protein